ncbi:MAG: hypothetical protein H0T51_02305 [Pirellulales bacterium]|nr:hypothetical protein [Pirellulales bacterium]
MATIDERLAMLHELSKLARVIHALENERRVRPVGTQRRKEIDAELWELGERQSAIRKTY